MCNLGNSESIMKTYNLSDYKTEFQQVTCNLKMKTNEENQCKKAVILAAKITKSKTNIYYNSRNLQTLKDQLKKMSEKY